MLIKKEKGFTLIELLIVVAIILIIAAIAIPNLLRSRMAANEASAVGSVRTIVTASITYDSTYGNFPSELDQVGGASTVTLAICDDALLIDSVLGGAAATKKSGYSFTMLPGAKDVTATGCTIKQSSDGFGVDAEPIQVGTTGQRSFCSDGSGVIRQNTSGAAFTLASAACSAGTGILGQ